MESVSMLNLNLGTLPSFPRGLLLFFLFFSHYLQFLLPFVIILIRQSQRGYHKKMGKNQIPDL